MRSMTGYGNATWTQKDRAFTVEIRSVNQRFLDVRINMPREYTPWERDLRQVVQEEVLRGKVDIGISRSGGNSALSTLEANLPLAQAYVDAWQQVRDHVQLSGEIDINVLLGRSDIVRVVEQRDDPEDTLEALHETLRRALRAFNRDREREGKALGKDMRERVRLLQRLQRTIQQRAKMLKPQFIERVQQRVAALLPDLALKEERVIQEVALLAERSDVTEELVRLASHLKAMGTLLSSREMVGKKVDFLLQEIHREFNTIASKSADLDITNCTLDARSQIEKLREQTQNIE